MVNSREVKDSYSTTYFMQPCTGEQNCVDLKEGLSNKTGILTCTDVSTILTGLTGKTEHNLMASFT